MSALKGKDNIGYVTFNHRWTASSVVKLESANIDSFKQCIHIDSLSDTFLDGIEVTRALGLRYLWVDSLCII